MFAILYYIIKKLTLRYIYSKRFA